jgi:hypothetical protein
MLVDLLILLADLADLVLHALFGRRFYSGSENKQRAEMIKEDSKKAGLRSPRRRGAPSEQT